MSAQHTMLNNARCLAPPARAKTCLTYPIGKPTHATNIQNGRAMGAKAERPIEPIETDQGCGQHRSRALAVPATSAPCWQAACGACFPTAPMLLCAAVWQLSAAALCAALLTAQAALATVCCCVRQLERPIVHTSQGNAYTCTPNTCSCTPSQ